MDEGERYDYFESPGENREQVGFLQDQVRRLTAVVREYQKKYTPLDEHDIQDAPLEPWMTDRTTTPPLFMEYDNNTEWMHDSK